MGASSSLSTRRDIVLCPHGMGEGPACPQAEAQLPPEFLTLTLWSSPEEMRTAGDVWAKLWGRWRHSSLHQGDPPHQSTACVGLTRAPGTSTAPRYVQPYSRPCAGHPQAPRRCPH